MLRGFLAGSSPQHTPPMGFVLFPWGFSHRDTHPSRAPWSSHTQPKAHVPASPAPPGHNNPAAPSFPRGHSKCHPVHRVSLIPPVYLHLIQEPQFANISSMPGSHSVIHSWVWFLFCFGFFFWLNITLKVGYDYFKISISHGKWFIHC